MALISEEVVEEWLNRQGFFTIRGAKKGLYEADILAVKISESGLDLRHYEVTVSYNPIGYLGGSTNAKKRSDQEIKDGLDQWFQKKYLIKQKSEIRNALVHGDWKFCLVIGKLRHEEEQAMLLKDNRFHEVINFSDVVDELSMNKKPKFTAGGSDLVRLIEMSKELRLKDT